LDLKFKKIKIRATFDSEKKGRIIKIYKLINWKTVNSLAMLFKYSLVNIIFLVNKDLIVFFLISNISNLYFIKYI